jgi:hypothetical protein
VALASGTDPADALGAVLIVFRIGRVVDAPWIAWKERTEGMNDSRTVDRKAPCFLVLLCSALAGTMAYAQGGDAAPGEKPLRVEKTRGLGQCEIFLLKGQPGNFEALVYNTTGLNDCPPGKFDPIDPEEVAKKAGSDMAWKNPRRFWMMDRLTVSLVGEPRDFDGLPFNYMAKMTMPPGFSPGKGQAGFAYQPTQIRRNSTYEFLKGKPVFLLRSPDGNTWVMQTYTTHTDPSLTEADLPNLARKLRLPEGWQFKAKTLDRDLVIHTTGLANIVPDNLENMYQGCIDGVCSFDPWN